MKGFVAAVAVASVLLAGSFFVASHAEAKVPPIATTATNVCVIYSVDGVYSGGIPIVWPATVSYRYVGQSGSAFLWLPGQDRLRVDTLSVTPLPPGGCFGIL